MFRKTNEIHRNYNSLMKAEAPIYIIYFPPSDKKQDVKARLKQISF
jgi:hypothetical protein